METGQREREVRLPVGYADKSGVVHRNAAIRKMRGTEEDLLYDRRLNAGRLITELIRACLLRLGHLERIDAEAVAGLTCADRNYLLLEIRRFTLGDQLVAGYVCPACDESVQLTEDLSQLEVRYLDDGEKLQPTTVQLHDGHAEEDGSLHREVTFRLPTGHDEEFVARTAEKDPLRARDALLLRCIEKFGTLRKAQLEGYGIKILRELTLGDRMLLFRAFQNGTPGVNFKRRLICGHCGSTFDTVLDGADFFALG